MHFNGLKLSGALEDFLALHNFWAQNCKNQIFEENKGLSAFFFRIEVQMISNLPSRLEKTTHP